MLSALQSAIRGIQSNQRGLDTVANNVANLNTDGYRAQRYDAGSDSVSPRHDEPLPEAEGDGAVPSDVELAEEIVDLKRYELGVRANAKVVQVSDRVTGTLLDILDDGSRRR